VPVIALIGTASGTGKTMASILLASEWVRQNKKVLLLDADPIGSATIWARRATDWGEHVPAFESFDEALARASIAALEAAHDFVLIDAPASEDELNHRVIGMADLVLIPCRARWNGVESLAEAAALISTARAQGATFDAAVLISRRSLTTQIDPDIQADLDAVGLPVLETRLHQRVILEQAVESGSNASEFAAGSPAAAEIEALANEIEARLRRNGARRSA
jgi:chromosome partitioning protein